jgi:hypothetical protein
MARDVRYPRDNCTHWFQPEGMRIVFQRLLDEAGVRTLCHLVAGEPVVEGNRITAVLVDTKRGRRAVTGRIFIDATGDGDVAAKAGVPFSFGRNEDGLVQGMTLMFSLWGIDPEARRAGGGDAAVEKLLAHMRELRDAGKFPPFNEANGGHHLRHACDHDLWNMLPVNGNPLDEGELTRLTVLARERLVQYLKLWRAEMPGFGKAVINQTAYAMGIRETRRIHGRVTLDREMVVGARKQPDAIGHGNWCIDCHDPKGTGSTTYVDVEDPAGAKDRLAPGTSYHIPLGMCLNDRIANLGVVGRCASATHLGLASVRVQTHCMVMGQGVGTAAALALGAGRELGKVEIGMLQSTLRADGVYLEDVPAP